jgi:hypothetical protein
MLIFSLRRAHQFLLVLNNYRFTSNKFGCPTRNTCSLVSESSKYLIRNFNWQFASRTRHRWSRGSSVSIVSDYGLDDRGLIPDRCRGVFFWLCIQTGSGAHPASCLLGTGGSFLGGKARPGRDVDHSPPSSVQIKNE